MNNKQKNIQTFFGYVYKKNPLDSFYDVPGHIVAAFLAFLLIGAPLSAATLDLGNGTRIDFITPAPVLDGEKLPAPDFDANGRATISGLTLARTITKLPGNSGYTVKLAVTNNRTAPVRLRALIPLQVTGGQNCRVTGKSVADWTVFRLARHKNDIPGPFRPTVRNAAAQEAATDNSQGVHGEDDPRKTGVGAVSFHADPGFVIIPDGSKGSARVSRADSVVPDAATDWTASPNALFIGFDGQTEHLSDLSLTLDKDLRALRSLSAVAEFDGVLVPPGATRETHTLYIQTGKNCDGLLADHVARIKARYGARLSPLKNIFCTWYFYGPEITADDIRADLAELKKRPVKFDTFLIDYNWDDNFGDWNTDTARFPGGMEAMAAEIRAAGLTPGLWSCPFFIAPASEALKKYPDLPLKNARGEKIRNKTMPFMDPCYILDPTAPNAEKFLTEICQKFRAWGYDYLKFDFLRVVILDENVVFHDPTQNRAQAFKRGIDIIRRAAGDDAVIGIWGALYEACAGFANIMRSGSDVRGHWDPLDPNAPNTRYPLRMRQTFARAFYDANGLWTSDQDALQLRRRAFENQWRTTRNHISMGNFTDEEAFSLAAYRFLGGGVIQVSDKLDELDQDRYDLYKMVIPTRAPVALPFNGWTDYVPEYFASHFNNHPALPAWSVVTLANWNGNAAKTLRFKPTDVPGLPRAGAYAAFEFKTQAFLGIYKPNETISQDIPAHGARVIRLTPLAKGNGVYLIGTDLNMSNGMEIAKIKNTTATLRPDVRDFPATITFINYKNGKATISKIHHNSNNKP